MFLPLIEMLSVVVCSSENANATEKYGVEDARNNKKQVEQQASLESSKTGHSTSTRGHEEAKGKKGIVGRTLDWLMGLNEKKTSYYNDPNGIGNIDKNGKPNERSKHAKTSAPSLSQGSYNRPSIIYYLDSPEFVGKTSFQVIKLIEKYYEDNNFCDLYLSWCESLSEVITESRDGIAKDTIASTISGHKIGTDPLRNCFKHITSTFNAKKSMPKDLNEQSELAEQTLAFFDLMIQELSDRFDNEIIYRNSLPKQKDDESTITFDGNADDEAKDKANTKEDDFVVKQNSEVIPNSEPLSYPETNKLSMLLGFLEDARKSIAELAETEENKCFDFLDYVTDLCADLYVYSKGFHDDIKSVYGRKMDKNEIFPRYHGIIEEFGNFVTKASFVKIANEKHKDLYFIFNTFGSCIKKTATQHMQIHLQPYQTRVKNFVITLREQISFTVEISKDLQVSTNIAETKRNSDDTSVKSFAKDPNTNSQTENENNKKIPSTSNQDKRSILNHTTSPSPIADASNDALSSAQPAETSEIETSDRTSFAKPEPPAPQTGRDERQNVLKVDGDVLVQAGAAECPQHSLSAEEEKKPKVVAQNALQNEVRKGFSPWQIGAACTIGITVALALAYLGVTKYYQ